MTRFAIIALVASVACGQTTKVFQLSQNRTQRDLQEIATLLGATASIQRVSVDETARNITVNATEGQIAMADWLVHQLDLPATGPFAGVHEYRPVSANSAVSDDVMRVFYVMHATTPQELQELVTTVRSVADVPRLFLYNTLHAVAARGTYRQISLAAWLLDQLDLPANMSGPAPHELKLPGDDVARVFELINPQSPQQLQQIATLIRTVADVQRLFIYTKSRSLALRTTQEQAALAAWLVGELDKPAGAASAGAAPREYQLSGGADNQVRILYLGNTQSAEGQQKTATQVRTITGMRRLFVYSPLGLLAVRGTAGQVATAEKVLEESIPAGSTPAP